MHQSLLFSKTLHEAPSDEVSVNARLLIRAGFIDKLMAGAYSYLPLGVRVIDNIARIIREELNAIGAQELLLPALHPKEAWEKTGRWKNPGREVMFQFTGRGDREYGLGWTHEEIITPLAKQFIHSYKDLPRAVYQIQTKFRDEPRAKSGLLRGREFLMKDLYSFHLNEEDLNGFYETTTKAYQRIFARMEMNPLLVEASGGAFSKYSHEFQVVTPAGEDIVMKCSKCDYAQNREIAEVESGGSCPKCGNTVEATRAIEVGNIFKLKTRFSKDFNLSVRDEGGKEQLVLMGCYGIGLGRVMGSVVEVHHDDAGIIWPSEISPFATHLIALQSTKEVRNFADKVYTSLQKAGIEVLYDERDGVSIGERFAEADLIGIPVRLVVSEKSIAGGGVEVKRRSERKNELVKPKDVPKYLLH